MTYPKLINKDLKNNLFNYDGGDLWIRENVSFWDENKVIVGSANNHFGLKP